MREGASTQAECGVVLIRQWLKDVAIVLLLIVLLPVWCLIALFYDEDPNDSYKMQNW